MDALERYIAACELLLYGLFAVTNLRVEWGPQLMGFSALVAGVIALLCGVFAWLGRPLT